MLAADLYPDNSYHQTDCLGCTHSCPSCLPVGRRLIMLQKTWHLSWCLTLVGRINDLSKIKRLKVCSSGFKWEECTWLVPIAYEWWLSFHSIYYTFVNGSTNKNNTLSSFPSYFLSLFMHTDKRAFTEHYPIYVLAILLSVQDWFIMCVSRSQCVWARDQDVQESPGWSGLERRTPAQESQGSVWAHSVGLHFYAGWDGYENTSLPEPQALPGEWWKGEKGAAQVMIGW